MASLIQKILKQARTTFSNNTEVFNENLFKLYNLMDVVTSSDLNLDISFAFQDSETQYDAPISYITIYEDNILSMSIFVLKSNKVVPLHNHPEMYGVIKVLAGKVIVDSYSLNTPKTFEAEIQLAITQEIERVKDTVQTDGPATADVSTSTSTLNQDVEEASNMVDVSLQISYPTVDASTSTTSTPNVDFAQIPNQNLIPLRRVISAEFDGRNIVDINSKPCILKPHESNIHEIRSVDGPAAFLDILAPPYNTEIPYVGPRICSYYANLGSVVKDVFLLQEINSPSFYWTDIKPYMGPDPTVEVE